MKVLDLLRTLLVTAIGLLIAEFAFAMFPPQIDRFFLHSAPGPAQRTYIDYVLSVDGAYFRNGSRKYDLFRALEIDSRRGNRLFYDKRLLLPYLNDSTFHEKLETVLVEDHEAMVIEDLILRSSDLELIQSAFSFETGTSQIATDLCSRATELELPMATRNALTKNCTAF